MRLLPNSIHYSPSDTSEREREEGRERKGRARNKEEGENPIKEGKGQR